MESPQNVLPKGRHDVGRWSEDPFPLSRSTAPIRKAETSCRREAWRRASVCHSFHVNSCQGLPERNKKHISCKGKIQCWYFCCSSCERPWSQQLLAQKQTLNSWVAARLAVALCFLLCKLLPLRAAQRGAVASHSRIAQSHQTSIFTFSKLLKNTFILTPSHSLPLHRWWHIFTSLFGAVDGCPSCRAADKSCNIN